MIKSKWNHGLVGLILFCTCEQTSTYQRAISLARCCWPVAEVLSFSFQIEDTTPTYDIFVVVKNTHDYPYQNLYITCYLENDVGNLVHQTLNNYTLFDKKTGKSLGHGFRQSKKHELSMIADYQFMHPGSYSLKLEHFMRTDLLPGIQEIGIKVIPSKQCSK